MRNAIILITTLLSLSAIAGTHGGGMESVQPFADVGSVGTMSQINIVYYQGEQNGVVTFSHGSIENGGWQIQKFEVMKSEMNLDSALTQAIEASKDSSQWVEIQ